MRVLVSGASGLVGSALVSRLQHEGHSVEALRRGTGTGGSAITWDPVAGRIDRNALLGFDAVVHLAGESVAGRWTANKRAKIRDSRVDGTRLLCEALASLDERPATLIVASAIGFYGERGETICDESTSVGSGFLADVAERWEATTHLALEAGIRTINLRIGIVLARQGGALRSMLLPFRLGLGGRVGSGRQYMSWISLRDLVAAMEHCLNDRRMIGPVNATAPKPVTQLEFAKTLAKILHRPACFPAPAFLVKGLLGEMGESLLLASTRAIPAALLKSGFEFSDQELEPALRAILSS